MELRARIEQLKRRRRSVPPNELNSLLVDAGFQYRWGGRNHAIYSHPKLAYNVSIKQEKPLKPAYVSKALRAIEEVFDEESD